MIVQDTCHQQKRITNVVEYNILTRWIVCPLQICINYFCTVDFFTCFRWYVGTSAGFSNLLLTALKGCWLLVATNFCCNLVSLGVISNLSAEESFLSSCQTVTWLWIDMQILSLQTVTWLWIDIQIRSLETVIFLWIAIQNLSLQTVTWLRIAIQILSMQPVTWLWIDFQM